MHWVENFYVVTVVAMKSVWADMMSRTCWWK